MTERSSSKGTAGRKGPSRFVVIGAASALLVGGAIVAGGFLVGPLVHDRVVAEAQARGVELTFNDVHFWWWSASIEGARFRLVGVPAVEGQAREISVSLTNWEPTQIVASGVTVNVSGSALDLAFALGEWTKNHPAAYALPVSADAIDVSWTQSSTDPPWLVTQGGSMTHSSTAVTFVTQKATVSGVDVGTVGATWTTAGAEVKLGFGTTDLTAAPVIASVQATAVPPTARIVLVPTDLTKLAAPLGVALPVSGVTSSATVDLVFTKGFEAGVVTGHVDARLDGFVPPHPVELDGFLFGNTTTVSSDFDASADRFTIELKRTRVQAGAFELSGSGHVARAGGGKVVTRSADGAEHTGVGTFWATIGLNLAGQLPCAAIAQSAAAAHAGTFLASLAGTAARRVLDGAVSVHVNITADSRNLNAAHVEPTIGVGCGLGPLETAGAKLLDDVQRRARDLTNTLLSAPH